MHTLLHLEWPSAAFLATVCICLTMIILQALMIFDAKQEKQGKREDQQDATKD